MHTGQEGSLIYSICCVNEKTLKRIAKKLIFQQLIEFIGRVPVKTR